MAHACPNTQHPGHVSLVIRVVAEYCAHEYLFSVIFDLLGSPPFAGPLQNPLCANNYILRCLYPVVEVSVQISFLFFCESTLFLLGSDDVLCASPE